MKLSAYDIIKKRIMTPKSVELFKKLRQTTFQVNKFANKIMIRQAVENIWDVKVDKVRTANRHGKSRRRGKNTGMTSAWKKAVVYLKSDYHIDLF